MPGYSSDLKDAIKRVTDNLTAIKLDKKLAGEVALTLQASNIKRIHNQGKAVNGSDIGKYKTDPIYVNPEKSPIKFAAQGKTGEEKFKNGNDHKTRYFRDGYKGFRDINGRRTDKVDLNLSGKLSAEFVTEKDGDNYNIGFLTQRSSDIAEGNEDRFKKTIWGVTANDEKVIKDIIETDLNDKLNGRRTG